MRILIFGCGGSGKSTLARKLGAMTGIPVIHLDQLYWRPGWQHVNEDEFDLLLIAELLKDNWIIDGNFNRTLPLRLEYSDIVIYLDLSRLTCLQSVIKRVIKNLGRTRPDMGTDCPEKIDLEFLSWIWNYNKKNRSRYYRLLSEQKNKDIHIVRKRKELGALLNELAEKAGYTV